MTQEIYTNTQTENGNSKKNAKTVVNIMHAYQDANLPVPMNVSTITTKHTYVKKMEVGETPKIANTDVMT